MYHPVIKNRLNELKGLGAVNSTAITEPIIELIDCKYDEFDKFMDMDFNKTNGYLKENKCFIDLPSYVDNQVINMFELNSPEKKFDFFVLIQSYFLKKGFKAFTPVISFDYSYRSERRSNRQNIKLIRKIEEHFDNFAIRIFADYSYKNQDIDLLGQVYAFYDDDLAERCHLIFDIDQYTMEHAFNFSKELVEDNLTKNIILLGEPFNNKHRTKTEHKCDILDNLHIKRLKYFNEHIETDNIFQYGDFTITDKVQSKLVLEEGQGFLYYPFINYTTPDGNMCKFTASTRGNYEQYEDLCKTVVSKVKNFSSQHCKACKFINDVSNKLDGLKFKAGSTWKYQMISHHITMMSKLYQT